MHILRLLAPNPGPWTGPGTNTYVLADPDGEVIVVDPGPDAAGHRDAILAAVNGRPVTAVIVTHHHADHTESATAVAAELRAPLLGWSGGGGGFKANQPVADGELIALGSEMIEVIHTPGHTADSICLLTAGELLAGDTVKGGSTVVVEDMAAYMATLERLIAVGPTRIHPGHGDPQLPGVLQEYLDHRRQREQQVAVSLAHGNSTMDELIRSVYGDLDAALVPLAARSIQAHVDKLVAEGRVTAEGEWLG